MREGGLLTDSVRAVGDHASGEVLIRADETRLQAHRQISLLPSISHIWISPLHYNEEHLHIAERFKATCARPVQ